MTAGCWTGPADEPRRYRVVTVDGEPVATASHGSRGVVYRARSSFRSVDGSERDVAIKLKPLLRIRDADELERRCHLLRQLDHPGLMRAVDAFVGSALTDAEPDDLDDDDFDLLWIATEWVPGTRLSDTTIDDTARVLRTVGDIARAVQALHDTRTDLTPDGMVHRDLKSSNVILRPDQTPVIIDYGSAGPLNEVWVPDGTPGWLAPEVASGEPARQPADRWGVGAIAHHLLCGRPPQLDGAACSLERLRPALRSSGLKKADAIAVHISRLLETDPARRPSDLARWADELDSLRLHADRRRRAVIVGGAAALVVAAIGASVALFLDHDGHRAWPERATCPRRVDDRLLKRPELAALNRALGDLPRHVCVTGVEKVLDATAARLTTIDSDPAGVVLTSPASDALRLTDAEYASWTRLWNIGGPETAASLAGYPVSVRTEPQPRATVVELSKGGLLIGPRPDSQLFWVPVEGRAQWVAGGGAGGLFGMPTSNPYFIKDAIRQDYEGGYSTVAIDAVQGKAGAFPFALGGASTVRVPAPGAELAEHGPVAHSALTQPDGSRWWIDGDLVRHWVPDDATAGCLDADPTPANTVSGVAIGTLRLGAPATCSMAPAPR